MDDFYRYLRDLHAKYPAFDPTNWIPPTERSRQIHGWQYRNIKYNLSTKTFWYELKSPNGKWSGPYHGRTINQLLAMDEL